MLLVVMAALFVLLTGVAYLIDRRRRTDAAGVWERRQQIAQATDARYRDSLANGGDGIDYRRRRYITSGGPCG